MPSLNPRPLLVVSTILLILAAAAAAETPQPLAVVGPDTLTTTDLRIELGLMRQRNTDDAAVATLDPDAVLRRMTQNQLIIQEGYRMGLADEFTVTNQVKEAVRHQFMAAMLDSVSAAAPADAPDVHEARRLAVADYLAELSRRFSVQIDSTLLRRLDYGSADPEMASYLRDSEDVLATIADRKLTVAEFSRAVRFTEYHGLVGKPDAADRRDKVLREWVAEATLMRQALAQGKDQTPEMETLAARLERNLVLEEALKILTQFDFAPTDDEIRTYYEAHLDAVTPAARVKMESLKTSGAEAAWALHEKLTKGATVRWLAANDERVVPGPSPFPEDWFRPDQLGLDPEGLKVGFVPDPYQVPTGWVVAVVSEIEQPQPTPLPECRDTILRMMKRDGLRAHMVDILARLEEVSPVVVLPGARDEAAQIMMETAIAEQQNRQGPAPAAD